MPLGVVPMDIPGRLSDTQRRLGCHNAPWRPVSSTTAGLCPRGRRAQDAHAAALEEKMLPGRGCGLVANETLYRGDRIFAQTPILILDDVAYNNLSDKDCIEIQNVAVERLPPVAKDMMLQLQGDFAADAISSRVDTNYFEV
ncbi:hypothetical protein HIM_02090 [Hirsutella minnesotensis 3608]|nr:hypothetical protein HIM_02090 [Hirsutella minnesotensis 3608]